MTPAEATAVTTAEARATPVTPAEAWAAAVPPAEARAGPERQLGTRDGSLRGKDRERYRNWQGNGCRRQRSNRGRSLWRREG
ncbi:hypothetical protein, partial [Mycobacterium sp.]|uniref:hypothetical protein n=1 Tax=Mycobacterium sp. TaxID=1785 RepID=UPI003C71A14B